MNDSANAVDGNDDHQDNDTDTDTTPLIQPIAASAVQRIVAGQAVTDLSSAVKELVDNAIDASAGRVVVKLHDQGLEAIEVSDDGSGVPQSSRPLMAMKHATSKLRQFDDLYQNHTSGNNGDDAVVACAPTLGFRGEALFCLANLSRSLVVSTRANDDELGEQFSFDKNGQLTTSSIQRLPRKVGTTVTVRGLFEALPVRRVDFCKRIKAQRTKLIKMMQGYAILCLTTQFNFTDVVGNNNTSSKLKSNSKSKRKTSSKSKKGGGVIFATSGSSKTLEVRIADVLGTKFLSGLCRIEIDLSEAVVSSKSQSPSSGDVTMTAEDGDGTNNNNNNNTNNTAIKENSQWKLEGLVSQAPALPKPSSARDLQFFSINGRPLDLPSLSRVLGDVWRTFDPTAETKGNNVGGSSSSGRLRLASILALTLPKDMYDVNLSPDKREVMFTEEAAMLELIRVGLMELWTGQTEGKFAANEMEKKTNAKSKKKCAGRNDGNAENSDEGPAKDAEYSKALSSLNGKEEEVFSTKTKDDFEVCDITPKFTIKDSANNQPFRTIFNLTAILVVSTTSINGLRNEILSPYLHKLKHYSC